MSQLFMAGIKISAELLHVKVYSFTKSTIQAHPASVVLIH